MPFAAMHVAARVARLKCGRTALYSAGYERLPDALVLRAFVVRHVEIPEEQRQLMDPAAVQGVARLVGDNVERVVVGKRREVLLVLVALLCRGHVLIEDVPGVGKTVLAKAVARSIGSTFKRIQFTPDLLPSDVTGVNVFNQQSGQFEYRPGPVVAQLVLADEINRATPKTQAALLEAMEEAQVTVDGVTHKLPEPFIVLATENPIEYEGTFPLPEAQLDRFLIRMRMGYPGREGELEMLERQHRAHPLDSLQQAVRLDDLVDRPDRGPGGPRRGARARVHRRSRRGDAQPRRRLPGRVAPRLPGSL